MVKLAIPIVLLVICYAIFFAYVAGTYAELPEKVASHFDLAGHANGWMSRDGCIGFTIGLGILMPAFIVGIMAGAGKIPISFINLPHRDYWLAPERRKPALAVLLRYSLWFASLNILFVTGLHGIVVQANRPGGDTHLSGVSLGILAGGFLTGTGLWIFLLVRRFSKIG